MSQTSSSGSKEGQSPGLITRACDMCRKKKIRCEPTSDTCLQCIKHKTKCRFTPISVKRNPRRPPGSKRIEDLEKKLQRMETQLKQVLEGHQLEIDAGSSNISTTLDTPGSIRSQSVASYSTQQFEEKGLLDPAYSKVGMTAQTLPDSGTYLPRTSFSTTLDSQIPMSSLNLISTTNPPSISSFKDLPPKDELLRIIKKSFQGFQSAYPLFDQATFIQTLETSTIKFGDLALWACLNVILSLNPLFGSTTTLEDNDAWGYFHNALAVSTQLTTMHCTLSSVQALLGMSMVMLSTPNPGPASLLTSSALKIAQKMGLHRRDQPPSLSAAEREQRKRVFWVAYCLDKDFSLQTGQPPTQDEDDMDVELPFEAGNPPKYADELTDADFFGFRVRLAVIQGHIYKRLCSVKASKQSAMERQIAAKELEDMLQTWKANVPHTFHQEDHRPGLQIQASEYVLPGILLQIVYFNALNVIHGSLPTPQMYREVQPLGNLWADEVHSLPASITLAAEARRAIQLLQATPQQHYSCVWAVLHIFVSATTTLLSYILSNPSNTLARTDIKLVQPMVTTLGILANKSKTDEVWEMYRSCKELFERAKSAVMNLDQVVVRRDRRGAGERAGERESVEDFLKRMENIREGRI